MTPQKLLLFPERLFLIIALFFGSCLVVIIPPFQSPDEYNHFFRAWQVSEGNFLPEKTANFRLGGYLPKSLDSLKHRFIFLKNNYAAKTSFEQILDASTIPLKNTDRKFIDFPNTAIYAPTAYFPQAIGIFIGRILEFPPLLILYLARWMNLLFWLIIVYYSIKTMYFHKWTLVFCALLPASLVIAASLNADVCTNALCFWLIANYLQNVQNSVGLLLAMLVTTLNKLVFAPFLLLQRVLVIKKIIYQDFFVSTAFVVLITSLYWGNLSKNLFIAYENYNPAFRDFQTLNVGVNADQQLNYIAHHPIAFSKIVFQSFAQSLPSTLAHLVGKFGWEKNYLPIWDIVLLWLGLILMTFSQNNSLSKRGRFWIFSCIAGCLVFFSITMYALWCPVGSPILLNLQGRYFLPLLPLLIIAVGQPYFQQEGKIKYINLGLWVISNALMLLSISFRYYN
jgi:uncharacterized membrane protein